MGAFRNFLRGNRALVAMLTALALAMKVLIPAGYMLDRSASVPVVVICPDANPAAVAKPQPASHGAHAHHDMGGKSVHDAGGGAKHGKHASGNPCPYSVLPMASLAGVDVLLLAVALSFILALGFAPIPAPLLARNPHLRPPLRGPPALV